MGLSEIRSKADNQIILEPDHQLHYAYKEEEDSQNMNTKKLKIQIQCEDEIVDSIYEDISTVMQQNITHYTFLMGYFDARLRF